MKEVIVNEELNFYVFGIVSSMCTKWVDNNSSQISKYSIFWEMIINIEAW